MRIIDRGSAILICLFGMAHLIVGHAAFLAPNPSRIWFASGGFLLVVTGLANLAALQAPARLISLTAAMGSLSILILGLLFASTQPTLLAEPQSLVLLLVGAVLSGLRIREIALAKRW